MHIHNLFLPLLATGSIITDTNKNLLPVLSDLIKTSVFRYYKANLQKQCPFWDEQLLCTMEGCEVIPAGQDEIKSYYQKEKTIRNMGIVDYSPTVLFGSEKKCVLDEDDFCHLEVISSFECRMKMMRRGFILIY
jgi:Endoplasmic Reticulum Oxidoreductin 1 (ERO1)